MSQPTDRLAERTYLALGLCDLDGDEHTSAFLLDDLGLGEAVTPEKVENAAKRRERASKVLAKRHPAV